MDKMSVCFISFYMLFFEYCITFHLVANLRFLDDRGKKRGYFNKVLIDDQSLCPNYTAESHIHICVSDCVLYVQQYKLDFFLFPLPVSLFIHSLSVTLVCATCSLNSLIMTGKESLVRSQCSRQTGCLFRLFFPWRADGGREGTKRPTHPWGWVSVVPSADWDEVSSVRAKTTSYPSS